jgi:hypothetical protein
MCIRADELLTGVHALEGGWPPENTVAPDPLHSCTPRSCTPAGCRGRRVTQRLSCLDMLQSMAGVSVALCHSPTTHQNDQCGVKILLSSARNLCVILEGPQKDILVTDFRPKDDMGMLGVAKTGHMCAGPEH